MTMRAINMKIAARARTEVRAGIAWVREHGGLAVRSAVCGQVAAFDQTADLVGLTAGLDQLQPIECQGSVAPGIMAAQTFRSAVKAPGLVALAAGSGRILDR